VLLFQSTTVAIAVATAPLFCTVPHGPVKAICASD
jgi:hypothetical protein